METHRNNTSPVGEPPLENHYPGLYRYLLRRLKGAREAEDLLQTIYLRFLQAPDVTAIRQPQAYLYRIAANVVSEYVLRRKSERIMFDSELAEALVERPETHTTDTALDEVHAEQVFKRVLQVLPATHRAVLVLFTQEGLEIPEIGARLQLDLATVRKYLRQALARFRSVEWNR